MTTQYVLTRPSAASLDLRKHNRNRYCGRHTLRGVLEEEGRRFKRYVSLRCKGWQCAECGPRKARRLKRQIIDCATRHNLTRLMTLTLDPAKVQAKDSVPYIRKTWAKFQTYLRRRYKVSVAFISVLELQKSGYAHLHVLIDRYIEQAWISEAWQAIGGGRIVDIRNVNIRSVGGYLGKYLTKDFLIGLKNRRYRRVTTSRAISLDDRPSINGRWDIVKAPIQSLHRKEGWWAVNAIKDSSGDLICFEVEYGSSLAMRQLGLLHAQIAQCRFEQHITDPTGHELIQKGRECPK